MLKKIFLASFFFITIGFLFSNGNEEVKNKNNYSSGINNIEYNLDLMNENSMPALELVNRQKKEQELLNRIEDILYNANNRVYFETHFGVIKSFNDSIYTVTEEADNYDDDLPLEMYFAPEVLFKLNLFNPKIYNSKKLLSKLYLVTEIAHYYNIKFDSGISNKMKQIEDELLAYNKQKYIKRISLGIGIPLSFEPGDDYTQNMKLSHINAFVGYDIMDIATVSIGYNLVTFDEFYVGISMDISTPVTYASKDFMLYLKNIFGVI